MDGVLCRYRLDARLEYLSRLCGRTANEIRAAIWTSGFEDRADAGELSAEAYLAGFGERIGMALTREQWVAARRGAMSPDPAMLDLVRRLGAQLPVALLTNNGFLLRETLPALAPELPPLFGNRVFIAAELGARKPDPAVAVNPAVTMAPASVLTMESRFGQTDRSLRLAGRAWFVVTHDSTRPFTVTTDGAVIEDLGTEFEINTTGPMTKVAVAVGAVAVHRTGAPSLTLSAGDLATVVSRGEPQVTHAMPIDRLSSWRVGTLDFIDRPLAEVAAELERWYDISVSVDPTVGAKLFNGPIPTDDLGQALSTIETAFKEVQLARTGRALTFGLKGAR